VAELVGLGACPLPHPDEGEPSVREAVDDFLRGRRGRPRSWPEHLGWLRSELDRAGGAGLSADDLPELFLGLRALSEAEALGLVLECRPGRFAALP
jgi:hypothetical protein